MKASCSSEQQLTITKPQSVTSQKTLTFFHFVHYNSITTI